MQYKNLIIYAASYPDIDPNTVHTYDELVSEGCMVFKKEFVETKRNDAKDAFGILMQVSFPNYNFVKIKYDYKFATTPFLKEEKDDAVSFTDGEKTVTIGRDVIDKYINKSIRECYVVQVNGLVNLGNGTDVEHYLVEEFMLQEGIMFKYGTHHVLLLQQIKKIEKMVSGLVLTDKYNVDNPNIFAYIPMS